MVFGILMPCIEFSPMWPSLLMIGKLSQGCTSSRLNLNLKTRMQTIYFNIAHDRVNKCKY